MNANVVDYITLATVIINGLIAIWNTLLHYECHLSCLNGKCCVLDQKVTTKTDYDDKDEKK
jgi:hypothetical protein